MTEVGGNPGRLIGAWRRFLDTHADATGLRGVGEAVYPGRTEAELAECLRYEELLNVAFDAATPFQVLCPYDLAALPAAIIEDARRAHPFVTGPAPGDRHASGASSPPTRPNCTPGRCPPGRATRPASASSAAGWAACARS